MADLTLEIGLILEARSNLFRLVQDPERERLLLAEPGIREQIIRADNHSTARHLPGFHRSKLQFIGSNCSSSQLGCDVN
jgi:hypothetical protein